MKKLFFVLFVCIALSVPSKVQAAGAAAAGTTMLIYIQQLFDAGFNRAEAVFNRLHWIQSVYSAYNTMMNTYENLLTSQEQLRTMWERERRALENLRSIIDLRSVQDFITWNNRQHQLLRESRWHFNSMTARVGNGITTMDNILNIPRDLSDNFDPMARFFSSRRQDELFENYGLAPGNYAYLSAWNEIRENRRLQILTYSEIFHAEHEEAAARNRALLYRYANRRDDLHEQEVLMETHATLMNIEMILREQNRLKIELAEHQLALDSMRNAPPTPMRLSTTYGDDPFRSITRGQGRSSYSW